MGTEGIADASQYLSFQIGIEEYAFNFNQVREVLDFKDITKVSRMPDFMRGVINLR